MRSRIMKYSGITIIYKPSSVCEEILGEILDELHRHGYRAVARWVEEAREGDVESADLVISLGGDGSLLKTSRLLRRRMPIVLPIPCGRRTALYEADIEPREAIRRIVRGEFFVEHLSRITVRFMNKAMYALNEILILNHYAGRVLIMDIDIRAPYMRSSFILEGDGLIVSTPPGSPAYNLSAGGPFVCSQIQCVVMTPLNPMNLNIRPLVLDPYTRVTVRPRAGYDLYVDGEHVASMEPGSSIEVEGDAPPLRVARFTLGEDHLRHVLTKRTLRFA